MKLKSLKIASLVFFILSFQNIYAEGDDQPVLSGIGCRSNDYKKYKGQNRAKCDDYLAKYKVASDAEKESLTEAFDREASTAALIIAEAAQGRSANKFCAKPKAERERRPASGKAVQPYGSNGLGRCDELAVGNMRTIYEKGNRIEIEWESYINYACNSKCDDAGAFETCVADKIAEAKKCEGAAHVMNSYGRQWSNADHIAVVDGSSSSGGGAVGAKTSANGSTASVSVGSNGATIKCSSKGVETVDYDACKEFQVKLDLMDMAQQVGYSAQELVYKDKMADSQLKYATEENTATGALKAQGESLKDQEGMFQQRTVVDAAKLGYLYTIYNTFPKKDEIIAKCDSIRASVTYNGKENAVSNKDCKEAVTPGQGGFAIMLNQQQIENMRARLIGIATSAGSNLLLANLLGKRADQVNNAIAKIDAFEPVDPYTTTESDAQSTFCKMNPGVASCLTGGLDRTFDTMNDNVITFGDIATGTSNGTTTNPDGSVISSGLTDSTTRTAVGPVGSVIAAAAQDNSMEKAGAASVKSGGTASTGGGGSGGGGGGSSGGGGGGNPGAAAAGQASAIASRAPNYNGGGGSFSVMGGFGINKKKGDGKTEDNPFGKLFGKDGANKGDVVNFRDIASQKVGGKGDNLFDMISKRYSSVNADKRLLEYELKK